MMISLAVQGKVGRRKSGGGRRVFQVVILYLYFFAWFCENQFRFVSIIAAKEAKTDMLISNGYLMILLDIEN